MQHPVIYTVGIRVLVPMLGYDAAPTTHLGEQGYNYLMIPIRQSRERATGTF